MNWLRATEAQSHLSKCKATYKAAPDVVHRISHFENMKRLGDTCKSLISMSAHMCD